MIGDDDDLPAIDLRLASTFEPPADRPRHAEHSEEVLIINARPQPAGRALPEPPAPRKNKRERRAERRSKAS